jgi:hypothetical protein
LGSYFFTHVFVALSHFMFFAFLQAAFVFGAEAVAATAMTGADTDSRRPATTAPLRILEIIWILLGFHGRYGR